VQVRPADLWMVGADLRRYLWNDAMQRIVVTGTDPDKPSPMSTVTMPFTFDWEDQWVTALGAEFRATPALTLRGGYNFGKSPVPDGTLNPLFPATTEQHATLGAGWTFAGNTVNLAIERAFSHTQSNPTTDPNQNPFGSGAFVDHSQWTFSLGFARAFAR